MNIHKNARHVPRRREHFVGLVLSRQTPEAAALVEEANTEGTCNAMIWGSPNLFLQVRENSKTWQMRWTVGDRIHSMGLGRAFDPVALDEARRLVGRYMEVVRDGGDPREARDRQRLEAGLKPAARRGPDAAQPVSINSFRDVTRAFLADRASSWKSDATEMHFARQMRDYAYPTMGDTPIDRIIIEHVVEVMAHADELTALDQAHGDGDHGINIKKGPFRVSERPKSRRKSPGKGMRN